MSMTREERAERWMRAGPIKMARRIVQLEDFIIEGMTEELNEAAEEALKSMYHAQDCVFTRKEKDGQDSAFCLTHGTFHDYLANS